jgi:hypothetical protein
VADDANSNINVADTATRGHTTTTERAGSKRSATSRRNPRTKIKIKVLELHKEVMGLKLHRQKQLVVRIGTLERWSREKEAKETETDVVVRESKAAERRMDRLL